MVECGVQQDWGDRRVQALQDRRMVDLIGMFNIPVVVATTCTQGVSVVIDKQAVLVAKRVWYYSENDEAAFFEWLDKMDCVEKYEGELDILSIYVNKALVDAASVYEFLALFRRYGVDMKQLLVFDREEFASWFRDPRAHWYKDIFG